MSKRKPRHKLASYWLAATCALSGLPTVALSQPTADRVRVPRTTTKRVRSLKRPVKQEQKAARPAQDTAEFWFSYAQTHGRDSRLNTVLHMALLRGLVAESSQAPGCDVTKLKVSGSRNAIAEFNWAYEGHCRQQARESRRSR
jgi:hypothetical protein